ncbi:C40 family peptidase [Paenibacillus chitinolyticus]|uniref:C40 family peptidase n=1 Tax=Paenibacillus chitinolyticus TaxID=79263 RepID=UPI002DB786A2|nr:SH3 domain-containing C40 family peptidase [Paenibacillus chitinolyticus]MEC0247856.1 SH3 domain-containing C40 family peptidase [Paenibacillus chitinolyticus]
MKKIAKLMLGLSLLAGSSLSAGAAFAETAPAITTSSTIITTGNPYLKQLPYSSQGKIYGTVPKGTQLTVLENTNKQYVKVKYNGQIGYISTLYLKAVGGGTSTAPAPSKPGTSGSGSATWSKQADSILSFAKSLQGKVQYVYAKNDTKNLIFDCSSFTKYVFNKEGINLPWGARAQYKLGTPVNKSELRKGDLVFFSTTATAGNKDTVNKIGHVGIYIGDNKFIHNVNPKDDVVIGDLNNTWQKNHYVASARILK